MTRRQNVLPLWLGGKTSFWNMHKVRNIFLNYDHVGETSCHVLDFSFFVGETFLLCIMILLLCLLLYYGAYNVTKHSVPRHHSDGGETLLQS